MPESFSDQPSASLEPNSKEAHTRSDHESQPRQEDAHGRTDRGRVHAVRNSALSRGLLEALKRLGENLRTLRKMERELRATLRPTGIIADLLFDQFWASVLRLILEARLEEVGLAPKENASKKSASVPTLREGALPTLVLPEGDPIDDSDDSKSFDLDVFHRLALASRYGRAASREMYRALGLLILMRDRGEAALESWVRATMGIKDDDKGGSGNA